MIKSFRVDRFRGIRDLDVKNLNQINLIVGDNNSGKTSVLEALQLLSKPGDLSNFYRVARSREPISALGGTTLYESVTCLFTKEGEDLSLGVEAEFDNTRISCQAKGKEERIVVDPAEIAGTTSSLFELIGEQEAEQFQGKINYSYGSKQGTTQIKINTYSKSGGTLIPKNRLIRMAYIAPCDHLKGNLISQIVRVSGYKEVCVKALQLFDEDIEDILVLKSPIGGRGVDYIKHNQLGMMPLSTFGDGIKKVLVLANAIAQAADGILLIDEVETAIHKKYYDNIFNFIVKACKAFNVQLFVTTHSIEAVDGLLATQEYEKQDVMDDISVITIKKENGKSYSRVLAGRDVAGDREAFGFEVRL